MLYVLLAITLIAVVVALLMVRKAEEASRSIRYLRAVVDHQRDYMFLVNGEFEVRETNFYAGKQPAADEPNVLGNVLHCKNAHDAGRCGEHEACHSCPLRFVISKSFARRDGFRDLEACMELNGDDGRTVDVDVQVDGHYVCLDSQDHMVVNVKDVTEQVGQGSPKVLFVSENVRLFDKVRTALQGQFRVLSADNQHQALHRLLLATDYRFRAVLTDEAFFDQHEVITKMLIKNTQMPVFVFTSNKDREADGQVRFLKSDINDQELLVALLHSAVA
jgi:hypothetical protein